MHFDLEQILQRKRIVQKKVFDENKQLIREKYIRPCRRLIVVNISTGDCEALTAEELAKRLKVKAHSFEVMMYKRSFKKQFIPFAYEDQLYEWANEKF